ncbi:acyl-CoA dehydratase activase-related protein [Natranaerobius trueperi]|uniref:2-hydroxyglutaryl-CoA dehydratase n=1 Tax=Natranaerobius trueperi TaxID=759412 RepID=A0A226BWB2_9FIRM|nr:acyl-CoA dehydratase activase-related protein [Natranaerobius trueperi]OWZ83286.1 2-hydroxyglutaryl-CoA dehydratase [Natranaerobius trueperi]
MALKVGMPRSLAYYTYFPLWNTFFKELGVEVLLSNESNKQVLDQGVKETVNDACVPIKMYHGHVKDLMEKVDYLFIPRLVSLDGEETVCPKFLGLPDMVRYSIDGLPPIIDNRLDLRKGKLEFWKFFYRIGRKLDKSFWKILMSYRAAWDKFNKYQSLLLKEYSPQEAWELIDKDQSRGDKIQQKGDITIALLGYPYTIYDPYISVGLLDNLKKMNVKVLTKDNVPSVDLLRQRKKFAKEMFWYYSNQVVRSALYYLEKPRVDGVIHVTAFGCGPDAMVDKFVELECKHSGVPFLTLSLDEHTGEAGMNTRVEAFVDMLKRKRG